MMLSTRCSPDGPTIASSAKATPKNFTLPLLSPSGGYGLLGNGATFGRRESSSAGLAALGRAELTQGDSGGIPGIGNLQDLRQLARGLLDDLPCELIGVAEALGPTCSGRHGADCGTEGGKKMRRVKSKLDHYHPFRLS